MSDVKIQINSAEALMRLIGDSTEMQMLVRDNIANEFITNHIKPLLTDTKYTQFKTEIANQLQKAKDDIVHEMLHTKVTDYDRIVEGSPEEFPLSAVIKKQIKAAVQLAMAAIIKDEIETKFTLLKAQIETKFTLLKAQIDGLFNKNQIKLEEFIIKTIKVMVSTHLGVALKEMTEHLAEMAVFYKDQTKERKLEDRNISLHL